MRYLDAKTDPTLLKVFGQNPDLAGDGYSQKDERRRRFHCPY